MDKQLEETRILQGVWSATANSLKTRYERVRALCFVLTIAAALLAALASQLPDFAGKQPGAPGGNLRLWLSMISAVCLALIGFLSTRFLGSQNAAAWIRARSASEALKRAAFAYAAKGAPYFPAASGNPVDAFVKDRAAIEAQVNDLAIHQVASTGGSTPDDFIETKKYVDIRCTRQRDWYKKKAAQAQSGAKKLRAVELTLALIATVLTAVVGVLGKAKIGGVSFDMVALTGVLTTLSGAILAYVEASRFDFLVTSYRATERQLSELFAGAPAEFDVNSAAWPEFVRNVEAILAAENAAWMAKAFKGK
jgi:hypothetical protein